MSYRSKVIIGIIIGVIFMTIVIATLLRSFNVGGDDTIVQLEMWGVFDNPNVYSEIFDEYRKIHKNVNFNYRSFEYGDYENALINAFAAGNGPDIYLIHNTWLPKHLDKLAPLPSQNSKTGETFITLPEYERTFVDVASHDLVAGGRIYGAPLYVDTLALYYNKDLFNDAGI